MVIKRANAFKFLIITLLFLFILIPGRPGWFDGFPLSQLHELLSLTILGAVLFFLPIKPPKKSAIYWNLTAILIVLIAGKAALGFLSLPQGLVGSYYYANADGKNYEKSTEFIRSKIDGTRIDREINFETVGYFFNVQQFPLWFFNDKERFNFIDGSRASLPFHVEWKGYIYVPPNKSTIGLETKDKASLYIKDIKIYDSETPLDKASLELIGEDFKDKVFPITINYTALERPYKKLRLSWEGNFGSKATIKNSLFPQRYGKERIVFDWYLGILDLLIKILVAALTFFTFYIFTAKSSWKTWFYSYKPYLMILFFVIFYYLTATTLSKAMGSEYFNILDGGNDPLVYETFARHLQLTNDWLMKTYQKSSYYWQILYYHSLAIAHYIVGESLFPIAFLQLVSVLITALLTFFISLYLFKKDGQIKNFWLLLPVFVLSATYPHATQQITEFFPVGTMLAVATAAMLLFTEKKIKKGGGWLALVALSGIISGLMLLMRTNFALWFFLISLWFVLSFGKSFIKYLAVFLAGVTATIAPFVIRNKIISGQFELMSNSNPTINFINHTPIPQDYIASATDYSAIFKWTNKILDGRSHDTIRWIIDEPISYLNFLQEKFMGLIDTSAHGVSLWPIFILFIISSILFITKPKIFSPESKRKDYLIVGGFVWAQLIALLIFGKQEVRYLAPLVPFLIIFSIGIILPLEKILKKFWDYLSAKAPKSFTS